MARNNTQDAFRTAKEQRVESVHKRRQHLQMQVKLRKGNVAKVKYLQNCQEWEKWHVRKKGYIIIQ